VNPITNLIPGIRAFRPFLAGLSLLFATILLSNHSVSAETSTANGQNITIQDRTFYKDGEPWILKGVDLAGLAKSPHQRARDKGAAQAKDYWNDAEIKAIRKVLGVDTLRLQVSPAGLDLQSSDYDPNYIAELRDNIGSVRKMGFVVILGMDPQQDHPTGSPESCMPSEGTARAWKTIAPSFTHDRGIMFELFNEPCKSLNEQSKAEWVQGMQNLIDTVRSLGSTNILLLDGLWWARTTNGLFPLVHDTLPNRMALAVHPYFSKGAFQNEKQWHDQFGASAERYPLVASEWNATPTNGCAGPETPAVAVSLMKYLEKLHVGLVGWGIESSYGKLFKDHTSFELTDYSTFEDCSKTPEDSGGGKLFANYPND
jgi:endoglucanase